MIQINPVVDRQSKKQETHTYVAQWAVYSLAWSIRPDKRNRLAVGSFLEDYTNKVELIHFNPDSDSDLDLDSESESKSKSNSTSKATFTAATTTTSADRLLFDHPYAPTNLMFYPSEDTSCPDLLATSGDYLRLWEINDDKVQVKTLLHNNNNNNNKNTATATATATATPSSFNSAITSFDWAVFEPSRIATCSVDTTCTVWDIASESVDTQLVAHDKEVYDISWGGPGIFATVSADGSARVFDLRDKERSTIVYDNHPINPIPMMRIEWNKADPRFIAAVGTDSDRIVILDIRYPTAPVAELQKHRASINALAWAPLTGRYLCSVGDDSKAFIWDINDHHGRRHRHCGVNNNNNNYSNIADKLDDHNHLPVMWFGSSSELNNVRWSPLESDWIAIAFLNKLQLLKL